MVTKRTAKKSRKPIPAWLIEDLEWDESLWECVNNSVKKDWMRWGSKSRTATPCWIVFEKPKKPTWWGFEVSVSDDAINWTPIALCSSMEKADFIGRNEEAEYFVVVRVPRQ